MDMAAGTARAQSELRDLNCAVRFERSGRDEIRRGLRLISFAICYLGPHGLRVPD